MKYAIVESGGKQYKVVEGESILVDHLPVEDGHDVTLEKVLLLVEDDKFSVGTPLVKKVKVKTTVLGHEKGPKIVVFHYRPKKHYRVKTGHRQNYTRLLIESIVME